MLTSEDKNLIDQARFISQQARDSAPHYEHSQIGYNYRMSNILAAIGRGQLRVLDEQGPKKTGDLSVLSTGMGNLPGIEFMPEPPYSRSSKWLTGILITPGVFGADREAVRLSLEAANMNHAPYGNPCICNPFLKSRMGQRA